MSARTDDDRKSSTSSSSIRRRNLQLRKLLDDIKVTSEYQPAKLNKRRLSPGGRSDLTEQTEKV